MQALPLARANLAWPCPHVSVSERRFCDSRDLERPMQWPVVLHSSSALLGLVSGLAVERSELRGRRKLVAAARAWSSGLFVSCLLSALNVPFVSRSSRAAQSGSLERGVQAGASCTVLLARLRACSQRTNVEYARFAPQCRSLGTAGLHLRERRARPHGSLVRRIRCQPAFHNPHVFRPRFAT